jgi:hypothetical protein
MSYHFDVALDGRCYARRDGQIVFRDVQHITTSYMAGLAEGIARAIVQATPK